MDFLPNTAFDDNTGLIPVHSDALNSASGIQPLGGGLHAAQAAIRIEAEDLDLTGYKIETIESANYVSSDGLISLRGSGKHSGKAEGVFQGPAGQYDIKVGFYDENDGQASASVTINEAQESFHFTEDLDGDRPTAKTATNRITHQSIQLKQGDRFGIEGTQSKSEFARFDYIEFIPVGNSDPVNPPTPNPDPVDPSTPAFDPSYPVMRELASAGVEGGIPKNLSVVTTIKPGDNIQAAINDANRQGGGVVFLKNGTYQVNAQINFEDNVVLRGQSRDGVVIQSTIRSRDTTSTFLFDDDEYAGIENVTIDYHVPNLEPIERGSITEGRYTRDHYSNDPEGRKDLYVRHVDIASNSENNWINGVSLLDAGTNPIRVSGSHNTLSNNLVDGSYNKGAGGNGYYAINGDYNLIRNETVKNIRHFSIQGGAEYNVLIDSKIEGDINFHNGDDGNNLVESNEIVRPAWHAWEAFGTGGARYGHRPPGDGNIIFNNTVTDYRDGGSAFSEKGVIYTYKGFGEAKATDWEAPSGGTFYFI